MNATELIRSYVSRIERLEAEIAVLNGDKAEIYVEAKSKGIDVPTLKELIGERRKKSKDPNKFEERQTLLDIYRDALDNGVVVEHARAPARTRPTKTDRAATSSAPEGPADLGKPPRPEPIPETPAGERPQRSTDGDPVAARVSSSRAVPAGAHDKSGGPDSAGPAATNAIIPREGQDSAAPTQTPTDDGIRPGSQEVADDDADWRTRDAAGNYGVAYSAIRERHVASGQARLDPDLARMTEAELVERAMAEKPAQPWRAA